MMHSFIPGAFIFFITLLGSLNVSAQSATMLARPMGVSRPALVATAFVPMRSDIRMGCSMTFGLTTIRFPYNRARVLSSSLILTDITNINTSSGSSVSEHIFSEDNHDAYFIG